MSSEGTASKSLRKSLLEDAATKILAMRAKAKKERRERIYKGDLLMIIDEVQRVDPSISRNAILSYTFRKQIKEKEANPESSSEESDTAEVDEESESEPESEDPHGPEDHRTAVARKLVMDTAASYYAEAREDMNLRGWSRLRKRDMEEIVQRANAEHGTNFKLNFETIRRRFQRGSLTTYDPEKEEKYIANALAALEDNKCNELYLSTENRASSVEPDTADIDAESEDPLVQTTPIDDSQAAVPYKLVMDTAATYYAEAREHLEERGLQHLSTKDINDILDRANAEHGTNYKLNLATLRKRYQHGNLTTYDPEKVAKYTSGVVEDKKFTKIIYSKMPILACVKIYHPWPASLPLDDENAKVRLLGRIATVPHPSRGMNYFTLQWTKATKERYEEMYMDENDFIDDEDRKRAQIVTKCEGNERNRRLLREAMAEANKLDQEELREALLEMDRDPIARRKRKKSLSKNPPKKKGAQAVKKVVKKAATQAKKKESPKKSVKEYNDDDDDDDESVSEYEQDEEDSEEEEKTTPSPRKRGKSRSRKTPPKKPTPKKRVAAKKKAIGKKKATAKKGKATLVKAAASSKKKAVPPSARKKPFSSSNTCAKQADNTAASWDLW